MEKLIELCINLFIAVGGVLAGWMFWRMRQGKQRKRKDIPPNANMMYEDNARLYFGCGVMAVTPFLALGVIILAKLDHGRYMGRDHPGGWNIFYPFTLSAYSAAAVSCDHFCDQG